MTRKSSGIVKQTLLTGDPGPILFEGHVFTEPFQILKIENCFHSDNIDRWICIFLNARGAKALLAPFRRIASDIAHWSGIT